MQLKHAAIKERAFSIFRWIGNSWNIQSLSVKRTLFNNIHCLLNAFVWHIYNYAKKSVKYVRIPSEILKFIALTLARIDDGSYDTSDC